MYRWRTTRKVVNPLDVAGLYSVPERFCRSHQEDNWAEAVRLVLSLPEDQGPVRTSLLCPECQAHMLGYRRSLVLHFFCSSGCWADDVHHEYQALPSEPVRLVPERALRSSIPPGLRFKVFNRDNFRCVYCGRGPSDGVKLQVDHVQPVSKGGTNDLLNLVTACSECNLGKGNKDIK